MPIAEVESKHSTQVFWPHRRLLLTVVIFGIFVNILMLTAPLFALQVYDRVLSSRSEETLLALFLLATFLFLMMGLLNYARKRIAARIGERLVTMLTPAAIKTLTGSGATNSHQLQDLDDLRRFMSCPAFTALLDLPWIPISLLFIALFHPWLGAVAALGVVVSLLFLLQKWHAAGGSNPDEDNAQKTARNLVDVAAKNPDLIWVYATQSTILKRWQGTQKSKRSQNVVLADRNDAIATTVVTFRIFLQSAMIGVGAHLVLQGQLTAGAIIAATVVMARAFAPLDQLINYVVVLRNGFAAYRRTLGLRMCEPDQSKLVQPKLAAGVNVEYATVFPPGAQRAALRMINFDLAAGQALGVIGPTGAGKSALARLLTGSWPQMGGAVRFGNTSAQSISQGALSSHIGYLPQDSRLIAGTIAENIARFDPDFDSQHIIDTARRVSAHEMIADLPAGYETILSANDPPVSAGLKHRIALARTIITSPMLLVFDEPCNDLDENGLQAFQDIVRRAKSDGCCVIILTQRPSAVAECDMILSLKNGLQEAFGPKETVLNRGANGVTPIRRADTNRATS